MRAADMFWRWVALLSLVRGSSWVLYRVAFIHSCDTYLFILFVRYNIRFWVLVNKNHSLPPKKLRDCFALLIPIRLFSLLIHPASTISQEFLVIVTTDESTTSTKSLSLASALPRPLWWPLVTATWLLLVGFIARSCACATTSGGSHPHTHVLVRRELIMACVPGAALRNGCLLKVISSFTVFLLLSLVLCPPLFCLTGGLFYYIKN